ARIRGAAALARRGRRAGRADAAMGCALLAHHRGARGARARGRRGRRGDDRRRQHRWRDTRDDHRHCARDLEGRPADGTRSGLRADCHRTTPEQRGAADQGCRAAALWLMAASILPLALDNVFYASNGQPIISGVSLAIEAGPSTIILGANGAGKSVLMRLMHGLLAPTSGRIDWNAPERPGAPRKQAMVFERPVMLRRSAYANVAYALKIAGLPEPQRGA